MIYGLTHLSKRNKKMSSKKTSLKYKQGEADFYARVPPKSYHWQYKAGYHNAKRDAAPELARAKELAGYIVQGILAVIVVIISIAVYFIGVLLS